MLQRYGFVAAEYGELEPNFNPAVLNGAKRLMERKIQEGPGPSCYITTLGCSKNLVDSELLVNALEEEGLRLVNDPSEAEVIVINTCGFIEASQQESVNAILEAEELKRKGSCRILAVTGCLPQRFGNELSESLPEIDIVLGTGNFLQLPALLRNWENNRQRGQRVCEITAPDLCYPEAAKRKLLTPKHSVYLKIAEGCSNCCSYCVIPFIRGKYRSRPMETIIEEAILLSQNGAREINLIAQDTSAYGCDLVPPQDLAGLLDGLTNIDNLGWLRILYTYPTRISKRLLEVIRDENEICKYLDLPLQHCNEDILKRMNRTGDCNGLLELIGTIREIVPDISLRTTFITGFPGETEREFEELMAFVEKAQFDWVGVFPYSPQEGTPAYDLKPRVSKKEAQKRADALMDLQSGITQKRISRFVGREVPVLVEGKAEENHEVYLGRTQGQAPEVDGLVYVQGASRQDIGQFVPVRIVRADNYDLVGEVTR